MSPQNSDNDPTNESDEEAPQSSNNNSKDERNEEVKRFYDEQQVAKKFKNAENNYLYFEGHIKQLYNGRLSLSYTNKSIWFWNDRSILILHDEHHKIWDFVYVDLFNNESRSIKCPKINTLAYDLYIYPLGNELAFIVEKFCRSSNVSLVKLELSSSEFKIIQHFDHTYQSLSILFDTMNSSNFIFQNVDNHVRLHQSCKLNGQEVEFGKIYRCEQYFNFYCADKLGAFSHWFLNKLGNVQITIYDLKTSKLNDPIELEAMEGNFYYESLDSEWINEKLFIVFGLRSPNSCGIAYTDLETKHWTMLDFVTTPLIEDFKYFANSLNNTLLCCSLEREVENNGAIKRKLKFYRIPLRRPFSLQELAWIANTNRLRKMQMNKDTTKGKL